jgi:hypothetical protein
LFTYLVAILVESPSDDSDGIDDVDFAPQKSTRKKAATSKPSSKSNTPAPSRASAAAKGKQKAKIVYLSDDIDGDDYDTDATISEYEDFAGDDDKVRTSRTSPVFQAHLLIVTTCSYMNQTRTMFLTTRSRKSLDHREARGP